MKILRAVSDSATLPHVTSLQSVYDMNEFNNINQTYKFFATVEHDTKMLKDFDGICSLRGGRHSGLMAGPLDFELSGPGSSPGQGHCVVFLGKTLHSHSASLHPGV